MKRVHGAVIGLMAMLLSGAAFAQGMSADNPRGNSTYSPNLSSVDINNSYKSTELKGMSVENRQKQKLGTISDLIIDKEGKVSNVVLHEGGLAGVGGHQYLVPWDRVQLSPGDKVAIIDVNKDQLSSEFSAMEENKGATDKDKEKEKAKKKSEKSGKSEKSEKPGEEGGKSSTPPPGK